MVLRLTQTRPFAFADAMSPAFGGGGAGVFAAGVAGVAFGVEAVAGVAVLAGVAAGVAGFAGPAVAVAGFTGVAAAVFDEDEAAGVVALSFAFVLSFDDVALELSVDDAGACAITRLAESTEPSTSNRVFFILILKLLSLELQAALPSTANCEATSCKESLGGLASGLILDGDSVTCRVSPAGSQ